MTENLLTFDKVKLLKDTKIILVERGLLPRMCPKKRCLSLGKVTLINNNVMVELDANPPLLPTTKKHRRFDTHSVCMNECGIEGNSNRFFKVEQSLQTSKIEEVGADWRRH